MRGPTGLEVFGTACSQVRWQLPPITNKSPQPRFQACDSPPPRGRIKNLRGAPSETVATSAVGNVRAMRSP